MKSHIRLGTGIWIERALSFFSIVISAAIFLLLVNYFREMVRFTSGMKAIANLSTILILGIAELAFIYCIGAGFHSCNRKLRLYRCFFKTTAAQSGVFAIGFFLRYTIPVRLAGAIVSLETIRSIQTPFLYYPVVFLAGSALLWTLGERYTPGIITRR